MHWLFSSTRIIEKAAKTLARTDLPDRRTADAKDAIPWHRWPSPGPYSLCLARWAELHHPSREGIWTCDIRDIEALSASKSSLRNFASLDEFALACCRREVGDASERALQACLKHGGMGVLKQPPSDDLVRYAWDGRLLLLNGDGSHHFAAARFIAGKLGRRVPVRVPLREFGLDVAAIARLLEQSALFLIPESTHGLNRALRWSGADFRFGDVPGAPLRWPGRAPEHRLLELSTHTRPGAKAAAVLRNQGFCDVGKALLEMAKRQTFLLPD